METVEELILVATNKISSEYIFKSNSKYYKLLEIHINILEKRN